MHSNLLLRFKLAVCLMVLLALFCAVPPLQAQAASRNFLPFAEPK